VYVCRDLNKLTSKLELWRRMLDTCQHKCKMVKTVGVVMTDTSVRFTSLLTKIAETITK